MVSYAKNQLLIKASIVPKESKALLTKKKQDTIDYIRLKYFEKISEDQYGIEHNKMIKLKRKTRMLTAQIQKPQKNSNILNFQANKMKIHLFQTEVAQKKRQMSAFYQEKSQIEMTVKAFTMRVNENRYTSAIFVKDWSIIFSLLNFFKKLKKKSKNCLISLEKKAIEAKLVSVSMSKVKKELNKKNNFQNHLLQSFLMTSLKVRSSIIFHSFQSKAKTCISSFLINIILPCKVKRKIDCYTKKCNFIRFKSKIFPFSFYSQISKA